MNFDYTDKVKTLQARLIAFMDEHIYPNEKRFFQEIADNRAKGNAWVGTEFDAVLDNNTTMDQLYQQINDLLQGLRAAKASRFE